MYRDIGSMDQGPGYLNGILSLILNTTSPAAKFSEEEQRAVPYFHRSRAADLLTLLDTKFPNSTDARNCTPSCWSSIQVLVRAKPSFAAVVSSLQVFPVLRNGPMSHC